MEQSWLSNISVDIDSIIKGVNEDKEKFEGMLEIYPNAEDIFNPRILKRKKKIIINRNCKKYLIIFIYF